MSKSLDAFSEFRNNLNNKRQLGNGDESFYANVFFEWNGQKQEEALKITLILTTWGYGRITLEEGTILNTKTVHTDFIPDLNGTKYHLISENRLSITGSSPKIGKYKVLIIEK